METNVFPNDYKAAMKVALRACRKGREVLLHHFGHLEKIEKKFKAGLVSEADKASEKAIIEVLKKAYPMSEVLGEESDAAGIKLKDAVGGPGGRWILDPLDGTTNYIHRFPIFCISLALEVNGEIQLGVVDMPMLKETYTAIKGGGAFVNGRPIKVSETKEIEDALLATGFFAEDKEALKEQISLFTNIVGEARAVRRPGAAAYDLALVAAGVFDGYWEKNLKPWDVAAGQLLVQEAGGVITNYTGEPHNPYSYQCVAANPSIAPKIRSRFKRGD